MELIRCILRQGTVFFLEGGWEEEERGAEKSEAYSVRVLLRNAPANRGKLSSDPLQITYKL